MKKWYVGSAAVIILAAGLYIVWNRANARSATSGELSGDGIEALRALPYTQWSENNANLKQSGVTKYDLDAASPGYNLFTNHQDEVYLQDLSGRAIRTWKVRRAKGCEYATLTDSGDLLIECESTGIVKLDWDSNLLWRTAMRVHHEIEIMPDGSLLTLVGEEPVMYQSRRVIFDTIVRLSDQGKPLNERWSTFLNLEKLKQFHPPSPLDTPPAKTLKNQSYSYYHMNTVKLLPETELGKRDRRFQAGNVLICSRNTNLIAILDRSTWDIVWSLPSIQLDGPHLPILLDTGTMLIFDNGTRRKYSRILEIEPVTGNIVWEYRGSPQSSFFSPWQGSAQRLPNGNTLICEANSGHFFEVTHAKNIVWEYWYPEIKKGKRKTIYRVTRLPVEMVESLLNKRE